MYTYDIYIYISIYIHCGYIGTMEKKMETIIWGYIGTAIEYGNIISI